VRRFSLVLDDEANGALERLVVRARAAAERAGAAHAVPSQNALILAAIVDAAQQEDGRETDEKT
jgi:hypothetical protein